jgi:hypothetical protein
MKADEMVLLKRCKMCSPGLSGAICGQCKVEDGGALRINRDHNGLVESENLIAEIKHPCL